MLHADPNNQSIIAFGAVVLLVVLGLVARVLINRGKSGKDRARMGDQLFL